MSYDSWKPNDVEGEAAAATAEMELREEYQVARVKALHGMGRMDLEALDARLMGELGMPTARPAYQGTGDLIDSILELEAAIAARAEAGR